MSLKYRFRKVLYRRDVCPWCNKIGMEFVIVKKGVGMTCSDHCGYSTWCAKANLSFEDRRALYDAKLSLRK